MKVAIYARVSTPRQAETQTIEQQIERLKTHVEAQGWLLEPEQIYRDDGYSGANLNRPGLDSLRDHAALVEFSVVLVTAPDRLARNYVHQMLLLEEFAKSNIRVEFLERPMSDDPHDRLLLQIRSAVAEYERTLIGERMRRGRLSKYRAGLLLPWGRRPFGFLLDPERPRDPTGVRIDQVEAAIVAQMFAWYLGPDGTLYQVAKRLNDLGVANPSGQSGWHTSTIRGILTNPAYAGTVYANRMRAVPAHQRLSALRPIGQGQSNILRPEAEWIPIPVPAIVDRETFDRVQEKLSQNQQAASRNNKQNPYLLRGRVSCGHCQLSARGRTLHGKYHYYVCHGRINPLHTFHAGTCTGRYAPADQLDELVWQDLVQVLTNPTIVAQALERAHGGYWLPQELQARLHKLETAVKQLDHQQARLLDAYLAGVVELAEFERKRGEITQKRESLQQQAAQLQATTEQRIELGKTLTSIELFCKQVREGLVETTFAQRRELIELLIDRVIVTDQTVEIRYVIPTQPDGPHLPFCLLRTDYRPPAAGTERHLCRSPMVFPAQPVERRQVQQGQTRRPAPAPAGRPGAHRR
jgi:site-specific DNA recombinase